MDPPGRLFHLCVQRITPRRAQRPMNKAVKEGDTSWILSYWGGQALFAWRAEIHSINQTINRSINQSIHRSINQSIDQSINPSINQSINQSINSINLSFNQSIIQSINQSIHQSINQSINQLRNSPVFCPTKLQFLWKLESKKCRLLVLPRPLSTSAALECLAVAFIPSNPGWAGKLWRVGFFERENPWRMRQKLSRRLFII